MDRLILSLTPAQCRALARLLSHHAAAWAEAEGRHPEPSLPEEELEPDDFEELAALRPLLAAFRSGR